MLDILSTRFRAYNNDEYWYRFGTTMPINTVNSVLNSWGYCHKSSFWLGGTYITFKSHSFIKHGNYICHKIPIILCNLNGLRWLEFFGSEKAKHVLKISI